MQLTLGVETIARTITRVLRAVPDLIKDAVDTFDDMGKAAQKVGVTVEALSRLNYAASLADVSFEGLQTGLGKLSQNLAAVAMGGTGPAATAFAALGISVTDANGALRNSDVVLAEVAEAFSQMENGSTKTALAVALFGKSGKDLIPMLNAGRDGLAQMATEADNLGVTISGSASASAEEFNDNITRLQAVWQGLINHLTAAALPTLQYLSEAMFGAARSGDVLKNFADGLITVFKTLVTVGVIVVETMKAIGGSIQTVLKAVNIAKVGIGSWGEAIHTLETGFTGIGVSAQESIDFVNGLWSAIDRGPTGVGSMPSFAEVGNLGRDFASVTPDLAEAAAGIRGVKEEAEKAKPALDAMGEAGKAALEGIKSSLSGMATSITKAFFAGEDASNQMFSAITSGLDSLADRFLNQGFDLLFDAIFGALGFGLSGATGTGMNFIPGITGIPGYAAGGSGRIGGSGGMDSKLFMAKVTPGEAFAFGDDATGGGGARNVHVTVGVAADSNGNLMPFVQSVVEDNNRMRVPSIVRHHANTSLPENGN